MQSENRFFDDLSKLINGTAGTVAGMSRELEANAREKVRAWLSDMVVSREEFEVVKQLAASAREEVEQLKSRIAELEDGKTKSAAKPRAGKGKT